MREYKSRLNKFPKFRNIIELRFLFIYITKFCEMYIF